MAGDAYFAAAGIGPDHEFDAELVAGGRRTVERMRMLGWKVTGSRPSDSE